MTTEQEWVARLLAAEAKNDALMEEVSRLRTLLSTCESEVVRLLGELADAYASMNTLVSEKGSLTDQSVTLRSMLDEWANASSSGATKQKIREILAQVDTPKTRK